MTRIRTKPRPFWIRFSWLALTFMCLPSPSIPNVIRVDSLLSLLNKETPFQVSLQSKLSPSRKIALQRSQAEGEDFLQQTLEGSTLDYSMVGGNVVLRERAQYSVQGYVLNEKIRGTLDWSAYSLRWCGLQH